MKQLMSVWLCALLLSGSIFFVIDVPDSVDGEEIVYAGQMYITRTPIYISGNDDFASQAMADGWPGNGTSENPYVIENYEIIGNSTGGIYIEDTTVHFIIRNCYLHNASGFNMFCSGISLIGNWSVMLNGIIENNIIENNQYGGILLYSSHHIIRNNIFMNNYLAIFPDGGNNIIDNNYFYGYGILLAGNNNIVTNNTLSCASISIGQSGYASSSNNIIKNNFIAFESWSGIYLVMQSNHNIIVNNTLFGNYYGIFLSQDGGMYGFPQYNQFYNNNFINNTINAFEEHDARAYKSIWNASYPTGGNFWSDYTGLDQFMGPHQDVPGSDGICDSNYTIPAGITIPQFNHADEYPLMEPISFTFPVIHRRPIRINKNSDFISRNGVISGNGTESNPYMIKNYIIDGNGYSYSIYVGNTTDHFIIQDCELYGADGALSVPYYPGANLVLYNVTNGSVFNTTFDGARRGVYARESTSFSILNCSATNNEWEGIILFNCSSFSIHNTTVHSNDWYGIFLTGTDSTFIYHNNLIDNGNQAYDDGNNFWNGTYPIGGNYWSDYTGADFNSTPAQNTPPPDGLGDTPMPIAGGSNYDHYPLMLPIENNKPTSSVNQIAPYWKNSITQITATATDFESGVNNVSLYYRYSSANETWGSWVHFGIVESAPWSWDFDFPLGEGYYEFHSIATDRVGNIEDSKTLPEAVCGYDEMLPIVNAGDDVITNFLFSRSAIASDALSGISQYLWSKQSGPGTITFSAPSSDGTNIQTGADGVYVIRLTVTDKAGNIAWDEFNLTWDTTPPIVDAGPDVIANSMFIQNTTVIDETTTVATYAWTKESGHGTITFGSPGQQNTSVSADEDGIYVIRLTAFDELGSWNYDEFNLTWDTTLPQSTVIQAQYWHKSNFTITANATDVGSGVENVTLFYRFSQDDSTWGNWIEYGTDSSTPWSWEFEFSNGDGYYQFYTISIDRAGNIEVMPSVADAVYAHYSGAPDIVDLSQEYTSTGELFAVTVEVDDFVDVGAVHVIYWFEGGAVTNASAHHVSASSYKFNISIPFSSTLSLNYRIAASNILGTWNSTTNKMVNVSDNDAPNANAGPNQIIQSGALVIFDGSLSTDNIGITNYTWYFTYNGTARHMYGVTPQFRFWSSGNYTVTLTVKDGAGNTDTDTMVVSVVLAEGTDTTPPIAHAGADKLVIAGTLIVFDGAASSDDTGIVNYTWTFIYNGTAIKLYGISPIFRFWAVGDYSVTLTVRDGAGNIGEDTLTVKVQAQDTVIVTIGPVVDIDENPIAGAIVTVAVNGETYSGVTGTDGKAYLELPISAQDQELNITINKDDFDPITYTTVLDDEGNLNEEPPTMANESTEKRSMILIYVIIVLLGIIVIMGIFINKSKPNDEMTSFGEHDEKSESKE